VGQRGGTIYIKTKPFILKSLHSFFFLGAMGQSNWFWPKILAQFVDESEHSGGFTNPKLSNQARVDTHFFYISR
jgi:hypothetical protein